MSVLNSWCAVGINFTQSARLNTNGTQGLLALHPRYLLFVLCRCFFTLHTKASQCLSTNDAELAVRISDSAGRSCIPLPAESSSWMMWGVCKLVERQVLLLVRTAASAINAVLVCAYLSTSCTAIVEVGYVAGLGFSLVLSHFFSHRISLALVWLSFCLVGIAASISMYRPLLPAFLQLQQLCAVFGCSA